MMNTSEYFAHVRSLGAFPANASLALAREAAELDRVAALKNLPKPRVVWYESLPDGSGTGKFSNGVTVY